MGARKTNQFSNAEIKTAKIANALAHPARIRILHLVQAEVIIRNVDLIIELNLVKSTIHEHVMKLKDANLIELEYYSNSYLIKPIKTNINAIPCLFEL